MFPTSSAQRTFVFTHMSWDSVEPARKMVVDRVQDDSAFGFFESASLPEEAPVSQAGPPSELPQGQSGQSELPEHHEVTIRVARMRDWPVLHRMMPELFPEVSEAAVSHLLRNERKAMLVAEVEGRVVGFCHMRVRHQGGVLWLNFIGVEKGLRRLGVGQALLRRVQECAAAWGCMRVELDVVVRNAAAVAFYDCSGYRCITTLVDDMGRVKYRYRREVQLGRVVHRQAPGLPSMSQRVWQRLLYDVWITGSTRVTEKLKRRKAAAEPSADVPKN